MSIFTAHPNTHKYKHKASHVYPPPHQPPPKTPSPLAPLSVEEIVPYPGADYEREWIFPPPSGGNLLTTSPSPPTSKKEHSHLPTPPAESKPPERPSESIPSLTTRWHILSHKSRLLSLKIAHWSIKSRALKAEISLTSNATTLSYPKPNPAMPNSHKRSTTDSDTLSNSDQDILTPLLNKLCECTPVSQAISRHKRLTEETILRHKRLAEEESRLKWERDVHHERLRLLKEESERLWRGVRKMEEEEERVRIVSEMEKRKGDGGGKRVASGSGRRVGSEGSFVWNGEEYEL
ncbi:hypothetical protein GLAREA_02508 [Glarea lozoyensis ATCC 20868]|uniref:Uncharacterized protein n=1 Tax=Glarea lozoyensis (strain ATCC 20868 / MF5171) TaxID=1116229 RepID=S3CLH0_GLAL2|nr:uncharacterized protein GLAREA_02508 [Glarea lozoyensis ATCC 20868]EPE26595.1 hypothetical protein GLAREA_02508 [Glarea lozoyensis ATCC 20868]